MKKKKDRDHDPLADRPFACRTSQDGKVFISWNGKVVMTLKDKKAETFLKRIADLDDARQQMAMAKITGQFKRGR